MEFVNSCVGATTATPVMFERLNTHINRMLGSHVLLDTDVRQLWVIMEELGLREQWKEMNAKIRAELEGISKHVDEANKILDANPPEPEFKLVHSGAWAAPMAWSNYSVPANWGVKYTGVVEKPVRFGLDKPELVSLPWAAWNCQVNTTVANANVKDIIPPKKQIIERRLFGEWDAVMEDVVEWHRRGLGYNVRLAYPFGHGYGYNVANVANVANVGYNVASVANVASPAYAYTTGFNGFNVANPGCTYKVVYGNKKE